ncbi:MAG: ABC transporter permease [Pyrinomonadaceae bacterium]
MIREVFDRRTLMYMLALREIKVKYKQSVMGMLWAVLMPLVIVGAGFIVRLVLATVSGKPVTILDLGSVAVKAAPWAFFIASIRFGTNSLISNTNLVTKVYVPRLVFPLSAVGSQLVDFLIATVVVAVSLTIARVGLSVHILWLPLLIAILVLLASTCAIFFSAASLFFRDVKFIVEVFLTFAIFFTPVFYESALLGARAPLLLLNPVSPILEGLSAAVIHHQAPSPFWLTYSVVITVVLFLSSLALFKKLEPYFAESI